MFLNKTPLLIILSTIILFGCFGSDVFAAFNEKINYQGKLTDSNNQAVADGDYCFKFRLMDALTVGNELWAETWTVATSKITTSSGLFSVMLGTYQSLSSVDFNQSSVYLEIQYDPGCDAVYEEVFAPRKQLGAVPAAFEAKKLAGATWAAPGTIGSGTPSTGAFTSLSASSAFTTSHGSILSSASGILTLGGTGATNNENLTLNFESAANTVAFGTGTGVTALNFGSFNLTTTGTVDATTGTFINLILSDLNIGRVPYIGADNYLSDSLNLEFDGTSLMATELYVGATTGVKFTSTTGLTGGILTLQGKATGGNNRLLEINFENANNTIISAVGASYGLSFGTNYLTRWTIDSSGHLQSGVDGTSAYNILTTGTLGSGTHTIGGATGVTLAGAAQVLTLAGIGGTYNENLTIDFDGAAANTVYIGTGTGVTALNFGSFNLTTTGTGRFDGGIGINDTITSGYGINLILTGSGRGLDFTINASTDGDTSYGNYIAGNTGTGNVNADRTIYGTYHDIDVAGTNVIAHAYGYGTYNDVSVAGFNTGYGTYNIGSTAGTDNYVYGVYSSLSSAAAGYLYGERILVKPQDANTTAYGMYIDDGNATTINNPDVLQIGVYLDWAYAGTDAYNKKWALYNASSNTTSGKVFLGIDSVKTYWGTGFDWSISADATSDLNITREVGAGKVNLGSAPLLTTGTLGSGTHTIGGATGITLAGAAQVLTLAGIGGTYNENLTIDFDGAAANTVYIGTGTGVTTINTGAIGITSTGLNTFGSSINATHIGGDMTFDNPGSEISGLSILNVAAIFGLSSLSVGGINEVSYMDIATIYDASYGTNLATGSATWTLNAANFALNDDKYLNFGAGTDVQIGWETTGNDNLQIGTAVGNAAYSGYISIMEKADLGNANRSPTGTSANPVLRVYSADAAVATDYIEFFHNQTTAVIQSGDGAISFAANNLTTTGTITGSGFYAGVSAGIDGTTCNDITVVKGIVTAGTCTSDVRFKENAAPLQNVLEKLSNIKGVYYNLNEVYRTGKPWATADREIGMIAQEVEAQFPELVSTSKEGYKSIKYSMFTSILVEAIKELNQKVDILGGGSITLSQVGGIGTGQVSGISSVSLGQSLADLGMTLVNGIATLKEVVADKFTVKTARIEKMEMVDSATGEVWCTWVANGEWQKAKGDCSSVAIAITETPVVLPPITSIETPEVQPEAQPEVQSEVQPEVHPQTDIEQVKKEVKEEVKQEMKQEIERELKQEVRQEVRKTVDTQVGSLKKDVQELGAQVEGISQQQEQAVQQQEQDPQQQEQIQQQEEQLESLQEQVEQLQAEEPTALLLRKLGRNFTVGISRISQGMVGFAASAVETIRPGEWLETLKEAGQLLNPVEPAKEFGRYIRGLWGKIF